MPRASPCQVVCSKCVFLCNCKVLYCHWYRTFVLERQRITRHKKNICLFMRLDIEVACVWVWESIGMCVVICVRPGRLWHAHFHATEAIARAVCCGIGDEQNVHLFKYLRENNVVFQAFSSITFESTETLTDMWCDYSTSNLECPGRRLASIFPCHRSDSKCSCGGVGDDWNVHLIQVFLKDMYVVAEAFVIGFSRPQRVWLICVASIPFLFRKILADFWQAYLNATRTIASGVFCGIGDE